MTTQFLPKPEMASTLATRECVALSSRELVLLNGEITLVDEQDFAELSKYRWYATHRANRDPRYIYAYARVNGRLISLHRYITKAPKGFPVDHINHDTLDNRRANLRVVTVAQNTSRMRGGRNKTGYRGVSAFRDYGFRAAIRHNGKNYHGTKYRATAAEAARDYDELAKKLKGEFACLNFPQTDAAEGVRGNIPPSAARGITGAGDLVIQNGGS